MTEKPKEEKCCQCGKLAVPIGWVSDEEKLLPLCVDCAKKLEAETIREQYDGEDFDWM